ncbi:MAG: asparagine synthase C-terminal domain-containing protein, partial [Hyphomonadaceae bacterium]|nr:asparagine synthase C-terminal domain-containing protein [Hyphomonadaceae bacterium]
TGSASAPLAATVTVVLSGEGADEMLAGYPQYLRGLSAAPASAAEQFDRFLKDSWYFTDDDAGLPAVGDGRRLRHASYFRERRLLEGMLAYDLKTWLPENLMMKADKILMSHSLEGRFPFLSKNIAEFLCDLPERHKVGDDGGKRLLRRAFAKKLPASITSRQKMGFTVPVDTLVLQMRERLYQLLSELAQSTLAQHLDFAALRRRVEAHFNATQPNGLWVWTLLVLLQWFSVENRARDIARPSRRKFDRIAAFVDA